MPHSRGLRACTRMLFSKGFREKGMPNVSTYLKTYKRGDLVDIKANPAIHKGMPYKFYHGKTGVVWNVTPRAVGVEMNKVVGNRVLKKRIHVRIEHVQHSKSRQEFLDRVKSNQVAKTEARAAGKPAPQLKRVQAQPRPGAIVKSKGKIEDMTVGAYALIM
mmetsp:Transcript_337/g.764  ORF Transcript_337/g.764 Transcript_337/m.764 type:complete len:161 (+) Transcript_337:78-560(+)|eukprot:CAMPEP_0177668408 /NCGR_PEP_ID=MMETSP0447-20121125/22746_1 /TAXON_ID=0 /ORGANISM="Stygamoeba regulata, Strain BSH-02190019" /LENGTH=160 /DNA_ID=CAMNT_0019174915 /DNA_START=53 /DNA_END=535 /DNA_ORIENTATION=-